MLARSSTIFDEKRDILLEVIRGPMHTAGARGVKDAFPRPGHGDPADFGLDAVLEEGEC